MGVKEKVVETVRVQGYGKNNEYLRVTIPKDFARELGIEPKDTLLVIFDRKRKQLIMKKFEAGALLAGLV